MFKKWFIDASVCGRSEISYKFSVKIRRKKNEIFSVAIRSRICI